MLTPVEELKIQAKRLLKQRFVPSTSLVLSTNGPLQLKHCQLFIARQYGFRDWEHARQVLSCEYGSLALDCGGFWYARGCAVLLNSWCRDHQEALEVKAKLGGVVLPYKTQFVVANKDYFDAIGLDYEEPLWRELDYDWSSGAKEVRQALALQRVTANSKLL
ncbi:hypothetical protein A9Q99_01070 [Gammaproteobacteria bacterium 45_16_T64]|nr:hypothetical protein A9Q99_01070 [Gammaproteobacteria bacterium 45_16_T64]